MSKVQSNVTLNKPIARSDISCVLAQAHPVQLMNPLIRCCCEGFYSGCWIILRLQKSFKVAFALETFVVLSYSITFIW